MEIVGLIILVILFALLSILIVFSATSFNAKKPFASILAGAVAGVFYVLAVGLIAPQEFGWSHVPKFAEEFTRRLDANTVYQLIASKKAGTSQILLVKETETSDFRAIRVDGSAPPPEYFVLINGKTIAVVAPAVAATASK